MLLRWSDLAVVAFGICADLAELTDTESANLVRRDLMGFPAVD